MHNFPQVVPMGSPEPPCNMILQAAELHLEKEYGPHAFKKSQNHFNYW
jgi:hypothetical protein